MRKLILCERLFQKVFKNTPKSTSVLNSPQRSIPKHSFGHPGALPLTSPLVLVPLQLVSPRYYPHRPCWTWLRCFWAQCSISSQLTKPFAHILSLLDHNGLKSGRKRGRDYRGLPWPIMLYPFALSLNFEFKAAWSLFKPSTTGYWLPVT